MKQARRPRGEEEFAKRSYPLTPSRTKAEPIATELKAERVLLSYFGGTLLKSAMSPSGMVG
jgi:hypothetical protein